MKETQKSLHKVDIFDFFVIVRSRFFISNTGRVFFFIYILCHEQSQNFNESF